MLCMTLELSSQTLSLIASGQVNTHNSNNTMRVFKDQAKFSDHKLQWVLFQCCAEVIAIIIAYMYVLFNVRSRICNFIQPQRSRQTSLTHPSARSRLVEQSGWADKHQRETIIRLLRRWDAPRTASAQTRRPVPLFAQSKFCTDCGCSEMHEARVETPFSRIFCTLKMYRNL